MPRGNDRLPSLQRSMRVTGAAGPWLFPGERGKQARVVLDAIRLSLLYACQYASTLDNRGKIGHDQRDDQLDFSAWRGLR